MNTTLMDNVGLLSKEITLDGRLSREPIFYATFPHNFLLSSELKFKTSSQPLLWELPDSLSIRKFDCTAYLHQQKSARPSKLKDHPNLGAYLEIWNNCFESNFGKKIGQWNLSTYYLTRQYSHGEKRTMYILIIRQWTRIRYHQQSFVTNNTRPSAK